MKFLGFFFVIFLFACNNENSNKSLDINKIDSTKVDTIANSTDDSNSFCIVMDYKNNAVVLGKKPLDKQVYLLDISGNKCTKALTKKHFNEYSSIEETFRTSLDKKINSNSIYQLAIFSDREETFENIHIENIESNSELRKLCEEIKSKNLIYQKDFEEVNEGNFDYDTLNFFKLYKPIFQSFKLFNKEYNILSYKSKDNWGPRFLIINNEIHPLFGLCTEENIFVFRFSNCYYLAGRSFCCGCGVTQYKVFKLDANGIKSVYIDFSLSD